MEKHVQQYKLLQQIQEKKIAEKRPEKKMKSGEKSCLDSPEVQIEKKERER